MNDVLLVVVLSDPAMLMFDLVDVIFAMPHVDPTVKELSVGITLLKNRNSRALLFPRTLKHS